MLTKISYPKSKEYRTSSENEPICFFLQALCASTEFDILLGYFSSSAINVLSIGFAKFLFNGGKVRMIINHILSSKDKTAVILGEASKHDNFSFSINDYNELKSTLNEYGEHFFRCIAWLIASKKITIKVVRPKSKGISHYKSGIFRDEQNEVRFKSSCNFTAFGLLENLALR